MRQFTYFKVDNINMWTPLRTVLLVTSTTGACCVCIFSATVVPAYSRSLAMTSLGISRKNPCHNRFLCLHGDATGAACRSLGCVSFFHGIACLSSEIGIILFLVYPPSHSQSRTYVLQLDSAICDFGVRPGKLRSRPDIWSGSLCRIYVRYTQQIYTSRYSGSCSY
jgi:hypothetical protein